MTFVQNKLGSLQIDLRALHSWRRLVAFFDSWQDGVNWLWFLNKYKLHGILCDDMGLGKTLQSLCILAGDHYNRHIAYQASLGFTLLEEVCADLTSTLGYY